MPVCLPHGSRTATHRRPPSPLWRRHLSPISLRYVPPFHLPVAHMERSTCLPRCTLFIYYTNLPSSPLPPPPSHPTFLPLQLHPLFASPQHLINICVMAPSWAVASGMTCWAWRCAAHVPARLTSPVFASFIYRLSMLALFVYRHEQQRPVSMTTHAVANTRQNLAEPSIIIAFSLMPFVVNNVLNGGTEEGRTCVAIAEKKIAVA